MIAYLNNKKIRKVDFHKSGGLDFSEIGYEGTPEYLQEDFDYAKQIYDNWDASITDRKNAFTEDKKLGHFPLVDTSNVTTMQDMFAKSSLKYIPVLDTSNVTTMQDMFGACTNLTSLDLSSFNTSKVNNMWAMFSGCTNLTSLDLSNLDTSNVSDMRFMFSDCKGLTSLDLSNFDTSNVTNMSSMFQTCNGLTSLDLSNFDTSNVTNMNSMFYGCEKLTSLYLSNFDTSKVTNMQNMFYCSKLQKVVGKINLKSINSTITQFYFTGYGQQKELRQLTFENIGYGDKMTSFNTTYITKWGVNSDDITDARQSLIDSLITYSFDRATAGYSNCTITLHGDSKAVLTEDEEIIAQITAKGFTIA